MNNIVLWSGRLCIGLLQGDMAGRLSELSLDEDNRRFLEDEVFESEDEAAEVIESLRENYAGNGGPLVYAVCRRDGEYVGHVEAVPIEGSREWEIGFHIGKPFTGNGYACEAVRAFMPYIMQKLGIDEMAGICRSDNVASAKVMEKCGFTLEGEKQALYLGQPHEIRRYVYRKYTQYRADVVVCGAGTAGTLAAMAAADAGASVILLEKSNVPGGSGSAGLVTPMMNTGTDAPYALTALSKEIDENMKLTGAGTDGAFDPVMLPFVLEEMLQKRGVQVLYDTTVTGADTAYLPDGTMQVTSVQVYNKSGKGKVHAHTFVDATGDGDLVRETGLYMMHGDETTGKNQPVSLRYIAGGIDMKKFEDYLGKFGITRAENGMLSSAVTTGTGKVWPLSGVFDENVKNGTITPDDAVYWQFFSIPGRTDAIAFNCPEFFDLPAADDQTALSGMYAMARRAILRQLMFYRKTFPGFENACIAQVAGLAGVRESRRAYTDYIMTAQDVVEKPAKPDAVCASDYPVDVHGRKLRFAVDAASDRPYYEIPLGTLPVACAKNLLVAGRNIGADFIAQSAVRIMPVCRAMGQAAGVVAALAAGKYGSDVHAVPHAEVMRHIKGE